MSKPHEVFASSEKYDPLLYEYYNDIRYYDNESSGIAKTRPRRPKQLFVCDLRELEIGTIIALWARHSKMPRVVWFKFIRGKRLYFVDEKGKADSVFLTDYGCMPYDEFVQDGYWNVTNWVELYGQQ